MQVYNTVMAFDWCQNLISAQYFESELMDFDQILHVHWYWQDLDLHCYF